MTKILLKSSGQGMTFYRQARLGAGYVLFILAWSLLASTLQLIAQERVSTQVEDVSTVYGPSWLNSLAVWFDDTCMGRVGRWGPPTGSQSVEKGEEKPFVLTGADLYRLSCQACHQASGKGCASEIRSLVHLIRQTSPTVVRTEVEKKGRVMSIEVARMLAREAEFSLLDRLEHGGERMPTFGHFGDDEKGALLNYLRRLAAVPESEAAAEISVTESPARVGELLVRGTCHICHDATKVDAQYSYTRNGEPIPPLSSFHQTIFIQQAIRKVRMGSPVPGGRRGRMPVFSYLTEEEIMAAYSYLATRPPQP